MSNSRLLCSLSSVALVALASCRSVPDDSVSRSVSHELVLTPSAAYKRNRDVEYLLPEPFESNPQPKYPEGVSDRKHPVAISVKLIVDSNGGVTHVLPLAEPDDPENRDFFDSVASACMRWRFTPLQVKRTSIVRVGEVFGLPKAKVVTQVDNLPFSLTYVFTFAEEIHSERISSDQPRG